MKPVPNAIRTEAPTVMNIAKGLFKIAHIKQFLVVIISISFLLFILRVIKLTSFVTSCAINGSMIFILVIYEYFSNRNRGNDPNKDNYSQIDSSNQWGYPTLQELPKYETKPFNPQDFPGEPNLCSICLHPIREGTDVAVLKCLHFFHPDCLVKWIKIRRFCPTCKIAID